MQNAWVGRLPENLAEGNGAPQPAPEYIAQVATVDIDRDSEPISVVVSDDHSFTGWMQLGTCTSGRNRRAGG